MSAYSDDLALREARQRFFVDSGLGMEADYASAWVKLDIRPFPVYFPNTPGRVRAVKLHDLHHVLTGYDASPQGEAEIAAWELASGCGHHVAAWFLNYVALTYGLATAPSRVFRAFVRGRRCLNLYRGEFEEAILDETVGALRRRLRLNNASGPPTLGDRVTFVGWVVLSAIPLTVGAVLAGLVLKASFRRPA